MSEQMTTDRSWYNCCRELFPSWKFLLRRSGMAGNYIGASESKLQFVSTFKFHGKWVDTFLLHCIVLVRFWKSSNILLELCIQKKGGFRSQGDLVLQQFVQEWVDTFLLHCSILVHFKYDFKSSDITWELCLWSKGGFRSQGDLGM